MKQRKSVTYKSAPLLVIQLFITSWIPQGNYVPLPSEYPTTICAVLWAVSSPLWYNSRLHIHVYLKIVANISRKQMKNLFWCQWSRNWINFLSVYTIRGYVYDARLNLRSVGPKFLCCGIIALVYPRQLFSLIDNRPFHHHENWWFPVIRWGLQLVGVIHNI